MFEKGKQMLYLQQAKVAQAMLDIYQKDNHISQKRLYLSGEMGVGKTYVASWLLSKLKFNHALIIAPKTVVQKLQKVIFEYTKIKADIINKDSNFTQLAPISIINYHNWKILEETSSIPQEYDTALKKLQNEFNNAKTRNDIISKNGSSDWLKIKDDTQTALKKLTPDFDMVIADEVHLLRPTTKEFAFLTSLLLNEQTKFLGLTGTLFNQNMYNLLQLLFISNPKLMHRFQDSTLSNEFQIDRNTVSPDSVYSSRLRNIAYFYNHVWRYLAGQLSLADLKKKQKNKDFDLKQAIMPLNGLPLSQEQKLWCMIADANMNKLGVNQKRRNKIINNYLDFPSLGQPILTRTKSKNTVDDFSIQFAKDPDKARARFQYFCGMALKPIKLNKTAKFMQCNKILKANQARQLSLFKIKH